MKRRRFIIDGGKVFLSSLCIPNFALANPQYIGVETEQITFGPDHHFFGYIGQSLTIPWNKNGNCLVCLSSSFHDHLPGKGEVANVNIINLEQSRFFWEKVQVIFQRRFKGRWHWHGRLRCRSTPIATKAA